MTDLSKMTPAQLRDHFRTQANVKTSKVQAVEFNGQTHYVRMISGNERDELVDGNMTTDIKGDKKGINVNARLNNRQKTARHVVKFYSNENGQRVFEDNDAHWVGNLDCKFLDAIHKAGMVFNGMEETAVEEEVENFTSTPNDSPGTDSACMLADSM